MRRDRVLAELRAVHQARADAAKAGREGVAAAVAEADAVRRELAALGAALRARLNELLEPPLAYDHVHGMIVRTDRMSTEKIKAAGANGPGPKRVGWTKAWRPVGMDPTWALRSRLAGKFWPGDPARQVQFCHNLDEIEAELLDGEETPVARMLVGDLVLTWAHSLWADNELVWETHRVGIVPGATVAMTRQAESLGRRFHSALRLWESYCRRTRGEVTTFPPRASDRISRFFAGAN
jgi:hypothetical protein